MKFWYAVQEDRTDAWDWGTYDYDEALEMLEEIHQETGKGLIAVINEDTGTCVEELDYDEVFEE